MKLKKWKSTSLSLAESLVRSPPIPVCIELFPSRSVLRGNGPIWKQYISGLWK